MVSRRTLGAAALLLVALHPGAARMLRQSDPPAVTPTGLELSAAINTFGSALFDALAAENDPAEGVGQVVSPFSVATALAMLLNGATPGSPTYDQLSAALGATGLSEDELNLQFQQLTADVTAERPDAGLRISSANSAWLKSAYTWQAAYEAALVEFYNATLGSLTTAAPINAWVSGATQGKITEIVSDEVVQQATLLLVNAIYFKGQWVDQFDKGATRAAPFNLADSRLVREVAMMKTRFDQGRAQFAVLNTTLDGVELQCPAIKLPYNGFTYSAVVAMAAGTLSYSTGATNSSTPLMLETAGGEKVQYSEALPACRRAMTAALQPGKAWPASEAPIVLYLPRFEIEFSAPLNDALQALNITGPFVPGDLTLMANQGSQPVTDLAVSEVLHKTYEKVDEMGTEASAVTVIAVGTSAPIETNPEVDLRFDRPFVFDIVHDETALVLFEGEIFKPEEWKQA